MYGAAQICQSDYSNADSFFFARCNALSILFAGLPVEEEISAIVSPSIYITVT